MDSELMSFVLSVINSGPMRVVINREGESLGMKPAFDAGSDFEIVFIRQDGWSLGAPLELATVVEKMWPDEWIAVMVPPSREPIRYETWKKAGDKTLKALLEIKRAGVVKKKFEQVLGRP